MFYAHPAELQVIRLIKRKNVIAGVEHRFMVHTDQRIVACPGNIFHACALTYIRDQWEIVHRKYHIIMRPPDLLLDHPLKFRTYVIASEFLFDIVHRMSKQQKSLLNVSVIICFPSVHQYVHSCPFLYPIYCLLCSTARRDLPPLFALPRAEAYIYRSHLRPCAFVRSESTPSDTPHGFSTYDRLSPQHIHNLQSPVPAPDIQTDQTPSPAVSRAPAAGTSQAPCHR